jgi:hypothetical protein
MGAAEIDDANATTAARTIVEEKRIASEDVIWDQPEILLEKIVRRQLVFMR